MMIRLVLRTLRFRWTGFLASFVAMILGSLLIMAWGGLLETGVRAAVPPQRLAGAPLVVSGDQEYTLPAGDSGTLTERVRLDAGLAGTIAAVPGVAGAVPDVSFGSALSTRDTTVPVSGHSWATAGLAPYTLVAGGAPRPDEVVLTAALAEHLHAGVGDTVTMTTGGKTATVKVSGTATATGVAATETFFLPEREALAALPAAGKVDAIAVLPAPGADQTALERAVGSAVRDAKAVVRTGDERGLAEFPNAQSRTIGLQIVAAVFGAMVLVVAILGVASPLSLAVQQRHREMALLRAVGATPGQLRRMILVETVLLSLVATALAVLPSPYLSRWIFDRLVTGDVAAPQMRFQHSWLPVLVTALVAVVATVVSAYIASRRAVSIRPTEALGEVEQPQRSIGKLRIVLAALSFTSCISLIVTTMVFLKGPLSASTAGSTTIMFVLGLALLGPVVLRPVLRVVAWPVRVIGGVAGRMAALNTKVRVARTVGVLTPVMLLIGVATADLYMGTSEVVMAKTIYTENLRADAAITAPAGGFADGALDEVNRIPGVAAASEFVTSVGYVESPADTEQTGEGWQLQGITAKGALDTTAVDLTAGTLTGLSGNTVALSQAHADALHRTVGDTITLHLGDGARVDARVVALFTAKPTFERILVPADLLAAHTTAGRPTTIMVRAEPGVSTAALTAALSTWAGSVPGAVVADREVLAESYSEGFNVQVLAIYLVVGVVISYGALAAANALTTATARRRREFGLQRLAGFTRHQVLRMAGAESLIVALGGVILGTLAGLVGLLPFLIARFDTVLPSGPVWIYLAVAGFTVALTVLATYVPSLLALRSRPIDSVAVE
ncbi:ABC transporter permease [Amycolatopsis sp. NPDC059021]|uniref:ABC transporter permease n=1 Tax=Amycolatopsis sp. NPDC059021 TaxID=3346704 RepID=UPI00366C7B6D